MVPHSELCIFDMSDEVSNRNGSSLVTDVDVFLFLGRILLYLVVLLRNPFCLIVNKSCQYLRMNTQTHVNNKLGAIYNNA